LNAVTVVSSTFSTAQVRYALATGKPLRCECTPECRTPDGFSLWRNARLPTPLLRQLRSRVSSRTPLRYFSCYCMIKTNQQSVKSTTSSKALYPRVSREEHYPGSRHKADLKVRWDFTVFVEIDGGSHNSTVQRKTTGDTKNPSWNTEVRRISYCVCVKPRWVSMGGVITSKLTLVGLARKHPNFTFLEKSQNVSLQNSHT
jgi:hypothetical protein